MKTPKEIASETVEGMTPAERIATAAELMEVARIIHLEAHGRECDFCEHCRLPYCPHFDSWKN